MLGDPQWDEKIAIISARILADAEGACLCDEPWPILIVAYNSLLGEERERVAYEEDFMRRWTGPTPGLAHGVGRKILRINRIVEVRRRVLGFVGR